MGEERRATGFNDQQFHELSIAVRAEVHEVHVKVLERLESIAVRLEQGDERMGRLESALDTNNKQTDEMRKAFDIAKRGLQTLGWLGAVIGWLIRKGWPLWAAGVGLAAYLKGHKT